MRVGRSKWAIGLILSLLLIAVGCGGSDSDSGAVDTGSRKGLPGNGHTVTIADDGFEDTAVSRVMVQHMLKRLGYETDTQALDVGVIYPALVDGDIDLTVDVVYPDGHAAYLKKYGKDLELLGPIVPNGYQIGLMVPAYVSDVTSIAQLKDHKDQFAREIVGIQAGTGSMTLLEKVVQHYDIADDFKIRYTSEAAETGALERATSKKRPILAVGWTPHWWSLEYDLRFLQDPKKAWGDVNEPMAAVRKGFGEETGMAAAHKLLSQMSWSLSEHTEMMKAVHDGMTVENVTAAFIEKHPDYVKRWMAGTQAPNGS